MRDPSSFQEQRRREAIGAAGSRAPVTNILTNPMQTLPGYPVLLIAWWTTCAQRRHCPGEWGCQARVAVPMVGPGVLTASQSVLKTPCRPISSSHSCFLSGSSLRTAYRRCSNSNANKQVSAPVPACVAIAGSPTSAMLQDSPASPVLDLTGCQYVSVYGPTLSDC